MKRFLAVLLCLCLLFGMTPGFADNKEKGPKPKFWEHELHEHEHGQELFERIWEAFRIPGEKPNKKDKFDQDAVRALIEKMIHGEELTEEELELQAKVSPIGLALLVSYTLTPPDVEAVEQITAALDVFAQKADSRQISEIPDAELGGVYSALGDLCAASGVTLVLTPVEEGSAANYITLIDPELHESEYENSALLYCEVPAKKKAEVPEIVEVVRVEKGEEAVQQMQQIAASDMTEEEAEQQLQAVVAPSVSTPVTEPAADPLPTAAPNQDITAEEVKPQQNKPANENKQEKYSYRVEQYYFNAIDGVITGGFVRKIVGTTQTTAQNALIVEAPASALEGYVFDENNENNTTSHKFNDPKREYIYRFLYVNDMPSATAEPTAAPTAEPTAEPTVAPTVEPTTAPTVAPTTAPTVAPTVKPTAAPTAEPTAEPTVAPTAAPTAAPAEPEEESPWTVDMYYEEELLACGYEEPTQYLYIMGVLYNGEILTFADFDVSIEAEGLEFDFVAQEDGVFEALIMNQLTEATEIPVKITITNLDTPDEFVVNTTLKITSLDDVEIPQISLDYDHMLVKQDSEESIALPGLTQEQMDAGWWFDAQIDDVDSEASFAIADDGSALVVNAERIDDMTVIIYLCNKNYMEVLDTFDLHVVHADQDVDAFDPLFSAELFYEDKLVFDPESEGASLLGFVAAFYDGEELTLAEYDFTVEADAPGMTIARDEGGEPIILVSGELVPGTIEGTVTVSLAGGECNVVRSFSIELVDANTLTEPEIIGASTEDVIVTVGETIELDKITISESAAEEGWRVHMQPRNWEYAKMEEDDDVYYVTGLMSGVTEIEHIISFGSLQTTKSTQRLIVCEEGQDPDDVIAANQPEIEMNMESSIWLKGETHIGSIQVKDFNGYSLPTDNYGVEVEYESDLIEICPAPDEFDMHLMGHPMDALEDGDVFDVSFTVNVYLEDYEEPVTETFELTVYTRGALVPPAVDDVPTDMIVLELGQDYDISELTLTSDENTVPSSGWDIWYSIGSNVQELVEEEYDDEGRLVKIIARNPGEGDLIYDLALNGCNYETIGTQRILVLEEGQSADDIDTNWNVEMYIDDQIVLDGAIEDQIGIGQLHRVQYEGEKLSYKNGQFTMELDIDVDGLSISAETGRNDPVIHISGAPTSGSMPENMTVTATFTRTDGTGKSYEIKRNISIVSSSTLDVPDLELNVQNFALEVGAENTIAMPTLTDDQYNEGWRIEYDVSNPEVLSADDNGNDRAEEIRVFGMVDGTVEFTVWVSYSNYRNEVGTVVITVGTGIFDEGGETGETWTVDMHVNSDLVVGAGVDLNDLSIGRINEVLFEDFQLFRDDYNLSVTTNQEGVTVTAETDNDEPALILGGAAPAAGTLTITVTISRDGFEDVFTGEFDITVHDFANMSKPELNLPSDPIVLAIGETTKIELPAVGQDGWELDWAIGGEGVETEDVEENGRITAINLTGVSDASGHFEYILRFHNHSYIAGTRSITVGNGGSSGEGGEGGEEETLWNVDIARMYERVVGEGVEADTLYVARLNKVIYEGEELSYLNGQYTINVTTDQTGVTVTPESGCEDPFLLFTGTPTGDSMEVTMTLSTVDGETHTDTWLVDIYHAEQLSPSYSAVPTGDIELKPEEDMTVNPVTLSDASVEDGWYSYLEVRDSSVATLMDGNTLRGMTSGETELVYKLRFYNFEPAIGAQKVTVVPASPWDVEMSFQHGMVFGNATTPIDVWAGQLHEVYYDGEYVTRSDYDLKVTISDPGLSVKPTNAIDPTLNVSGTPTLTSTLVTVSITLKSDPTQTYTVSENLPIKHVEELTVPTLVVPATDIVLEVGKTVTEDVLTLDANDSNWYVRHDLDIHEFASFNERDGVLTYTGLSRGNTTMHYSVQYWNYIVRQGSRNVIVTEEGENADTVDENWKVDISFMHKVVVGSSITSDNLYAGQVHEVYYGDTKLERKEFDVSATTSQSSVGVSPSSDDDPTLYFTAAPSVGSITVNVTVTASKYTSVPYTISYTIPIVDQTKLSLPEVTYDTSDIVLIVGESAEIAIPTLTPEDESADWQIGVSSSTNDYFETWYDSATGKHMITAKAAGEGAMTYTANYHNYHVGTVSRKVIVNSASSNTFSLLNVSEPELGGVDEVSGSDPVIEPEVTGVVTPSDTN